METVEVVIRVHENDYHSIKRDVAHGHCEEDNAIDNSFRAIANGTVLPKGHGKLIDETEILKFLRCPKYENCDWKNCSDCNESRCINFNNVNGLASMIEADGGSE